MQQGIEIIVENIEKTNLQIYYLKRKYYELKKHLADVTHSKYWFDIGPEFIQPRLDEMASIESTIKYQIGVRTGLFIALKYIDFDTYNKLFSSMENGELLAYKEFSSEGDKND